jgi:hypothetical protein
VLKKDRQLRIDKFTQNGDGEEQKVGSKKEEQKGRRKKKKKIPGRRGWRQHTTLPFFQRRGQLRCAQLPQLARRISYTVFSRPQLVQPQKKTKTKNKNNLHLLHPEAIVAAIF